MARAQVSIRLQKVLARAGIASRRAAEELIRSGRVRVDGRVITELGTKVDPRTSRVEVDGERITRESLVYLVLHKPRGMVSTMRDPEGRPSVRDLLAEIPARVFPIGRLDFNTSGVLLATNDGDFAEGLMHPRRAVPKTYVVKVQGEMKPADLDRWRKGLDLEDGKTLPAKVSLLRHEGDKTWIELTITEGRNQQVRRMGDASGFRVMRLSRVGFAGVTGEGLRPGEWRYLTADELSDLKKEYGVPRRVVGPPREAAGDRHPRPRPHGSPPPRPHGPPREAAGDRHPRPRPHGSPPPRPHGPPREAAGDRHPRPHGSPPPRPHGPPPPRPQGSLPPRSQGSPRPGPHGSPRPRPSDSPPRPRHDDPERTGRYGGGAPGRRPPATRDDWGGTIRRGSSGEHGEARGGEGADGNGDRPGRGRPGRTTGTGGGIGASRGNYRVRGRHG